jgi:hypothetical protein
MERPERSRPGVVIVTAGGPAYFASLPAQAHKAGSGHAANSLVSSIGASLRTPSQAFSSAASVVVDAIIVLLMALFITFPSAVFNSTFQENYQDISAWWSKWLAILFPPRLRRALLAGWRWSKSEVLRALGLASASESKKSERQWASFSLVLVVGSFLGALLDPSFGPNWRSVISYAAIVLAMATGVAVSGLVTGSYHRLRHHGKVPYKFEALPVGLAIATACVVVSRVTGFQPGYLYGVICGVAFGRELREHEEGHVVALGSVVKVVLAVAAWFAWDGVQHYAARSGSFFGAVLLDDFLASLFVSSLVGTVISLFPLRFLPGHKLQSWHKGAWAATLLVSLFVLVQVLLRPHGAGGPSHTPLVTTLVLFAVFGGGSVLFRQHFVRKRRREAALAPAGEGTEVVDVTDAARKAPAPPAPVGVPDAAAPAGAAPSP